MDFVKEIKDILMLPNHQKDNKLEFLNEVLEYGHGYDLEKEDIIEGLKLLLAAALREQEPMMKQRFLRTIFLAVVCRQGKYLRRSDIDWSSLAASLSSLSKWQLIYALDILGASGQNGYVPALDQYIHHVDPEISKRAMEGIDSIKFLSAYDADPQNGG